MQENWGWVRVKGLLIDLDQNIIKGPPRLQICKIKSISRPFKFRFQAETKNRQSARQHCLRESNTNLKNSIPQNVGSILPTSGDTEEEVSHFNLLQEVEAGVKKEELLQMPNTWWPNFLKSITGQVGVMGHSRRVLPSNGVIDHWSCHFLSTFLESDAEFNSPADISILSSQKTKVQGNFQTNVGTQFKYCIVFIYVT